jgi:hypothetical protein
MEKGRLAAKLDWNRMLGFEQIADARQAMRDESAFGPKVGLKAGVKVGIKLGVKQGLKVS